MSATDYKIESQLVISIYDSELTIFLGYLPSDLQQDDHGLNEQAQSVSHSHTDSCSLKRNRYKNHPRESILLVHLNDDTDETSLIYISIGTAGSDFTTIRSNIETGDT